LPFFLGKREKHQLQNIDTKNFHTSVTYSIGTK